MQHILKNIQVLQEKFMNIILKINKFYRTICVYICYILFVNVQQNREISLIMKLALS